MSDFELPSYVRDGLRHSVLTKKETADLIRKSQRGDKKATEKLVKHNMKFIYMIAKRFVFALPIEDLMQEGVCGLLKAISEFKLSTNFSLSTYSKLWIQAYCKRASQKNSGFTAFRSAKDRHSVKIERPLSIDTDMVSEEMSIGDTLAHDGELPDEKICSKELRNKIRHVLVTEVYTDSRSELITRRLAERGEPEWTLEKLGGQMGVSRERVRQLEVKVIGRLKSNRKLRKIAESA